MMYGGCAACNGHSRVPRLACLRLAMSAIKKAATASIQVYAMRNSARRACLCVEETPALGALRRPTWALPSCSRESNQNETWLVQRSFCRLTISGFDRKRAMNISDQRTGPATKIVLPNGSITSNVCAPQSSFLGGRRISTRELHSS